jgi:hypothetical protein
MTRGRPAPYDYLYPVTITPDRHGGAYAGGGWLAFPCRPSGVPTEAFGDDVVAAKWWTDAGDFPIGRGAAPNDAYEDLVRRLELIPPTSEYQAASEVSVSGWAWELVWPGGTQSLVARNWHDEGQGPKRVSR